jgi:hypothetical protein
VLLDYRPVLLEYGIQHLPWRQQQQTLDNDSR